MVTGILAAIIFYLLFYLFVVIGHLLVDKTLRRNHWQEGHVTILKKP